MTPATSGHVRLVVNNISPKYSLRFIIITRGGASENAHLRPITFLVPSIDALDRSRLAAWRDGVGARFEPFG